MLVKDIEKQRKNTQTLVENILGCNVKPSKDQKSVENAAPPAEEMKNDVPAVKMENGVPENQIIINAVFSLKG